MESGATEKPEGFDERLAALNSRLMKEGPPTEEVEATLRRFCESENWPPAGYARDAVVLIWANAHLKRNLASIAGSDHSTGDAPKPDRSERVQKQIVKIVSGIIWIGLAIALLSTNPSREQFEAFAAKEGFVSPTITRTDLGVASYYDIKGTFTGEHRTYLGLFHTFIRLPDISKAE
jgi:hypothetical protein